MARSSWKESFQPVKEKKGSGTGIGTSMPTMPTCTGTGDQLHATDLE